MRNVATFLVTTALVGLFHVNEARACSCAPPPPPITAVAKASAVFAGTIVEVTPPSTPSGEKIAKFSVDTVWKRSRTESIVEVHTPANDAACGLSFAPGQKWIIYAIEIEGTLSAALCSRSKPLDGAQEDLAALGPGTPLPPTVAPSQRGCACEMASDRELPWGAPLALAAAAVIAARRRRRLKAPPRGAARASSRSSA